MICQQEFRRGQWNARRAAGDGPETVLIYLDAKPAVIAGWPGEIPSTDMRPKVSVLLPVHNAAPYLAEAVESILGQTVADLELICIDDGSTDGSSEILRRYASQDARVRIERREHNGLIAALNEGLRLAHAPLVARMDADDISLPDRLELQYRRFELDPGLWVLGTAYERIDEAGRPRGRPPVIAGCEAVASALREKCVICHPSVMMRRDPILEIGGYRPAYKHAEDYDLWLRVSERGKLDNLNVVGLRYRKHDDGVSQRCSPRQRLSTALARATYALRRNGVPDPTSDMTVEPDLWTSALLNSLVPEHVAFYRMLAFAFAAPAVSFDHNQLKRRLSVLSPELIAQNKSLLLAAFVQMLKAQKKINFLSIKLVLMSLRINPSRFARFILTWDQSKPRLVWD